jgi:hypothetical protein
MLVDTSSGTDLVGFTEKACNIDMILWIEKSHHAH